jgi:phage N-6-adenine-methyltransferase
MADFDNNRFQSKSVEWATPQQLFAVLNDEFGFTLDVAASRENAKCGRYFTAENDALRQSWDGTCWMNPPYGREVPRWLEKAIAESKRGVTTVCLIPARTNTGWFHELCFRQGEVRFVRGRPKFGDADHGLPFPLAVVIYRPRYQTVQIA